ncbi:MAG: energy transducer TonB [Nitrospinae bacterium]|nr:energy transducer TonB [Nitrospinota bacterium]
MSKVMFQDKSTLYSLVGSLAVNMVITMGAGSFLISINKSLATQKTYNLEFIKRKTPPPVKKPPPPIKKKKIHKEIVRKKIKVQQPKVLPVVQPKALPVAQTKIAVANPKVVHQAIKVASLQPKALPTVQPKMTVRHSSSARPTVSVPNFAPRQFQTQSTTPARQSAVMHASSSITSRRASVNIPAARTVTTSNKKSNKGTTRMAMVENVGRFKAPKIPKLIARPSGNISTSKGPRGRTAPVLTGMKHAALSLPSSPRGVPNIVDRGALKGYIGQIQRIIENAKRYPEASRKAGREGKVKVQFTIFKNGEVDNIKLLTKTPYPNLNREAMNAVKRAAPFSGFPDSLGEKSLNVILPFRFELR